MRRLYQKIYLTIIVSLLLVVLVAGALWRFGTGAESAATQVFDIAGELIVNVLPPASDPPAAQQRALERIAARLEIDISLFDESRQRIASAGAPLPPPSRWSDEGGWAYSRSGPAWRIPLPDGRWIVARMPMRHRHPAIGLIFFLGSVALLIGLCAFPVVRGLTRRLERLQQGVETLGAGNLAARVKVEGRDEIARLAGSFNKAAERIEQLVGAHRMLLANASHELRTPLARIRLGIELMQEQPDAKRKTALERDIAELDALIDEILLASRLDATPNLAAAEEVDLLALLAEECAHYPDAALDGMPLTLRGDPRLLRRLVRNLLENARRYGKPPVSVTLRREGPQAVIEIADSGPGIPEAERERVFTPFYRLAGETTGFGLGLSLVRQIARLHGGDAVLSPLPGSPARFVVTLAA